MVGINEVQKVFQLENERNSINARIDHLNRSYLWSDDEKVKLLRTYESNLKEVEDSLIINPFA
jgi:septation ring formation regulator EzrA